MSEDRGWLSAFSRQAAQEIGMGRLMREPTIVPTGLPGIDRQFWYWGCREGIPRGEYVVVGGASNAGKTQFGLFLCKQAAQHGEKAAVFSLEMRQEDVLLRLHQVTTDIPSRRWSPRTWTIREGKKLLADVVAYRAEQMREDILVNAETGSDIGQVTAEIEAVIDDGVTFVMVDHLQIIGAQGFGEDSIPDRAATVSESLRKLAIRREVTIVALSQLVQSAARDTKRTPTIYDLWGGQPVTANPSIIIMLDHSRYDSDTQHPELARTWVVLGKNRMGPKNIEVAVQWDHAKLTLHEATPEEAEYRWPKHD